MITSQLDYCNTLYMGLPLQTIWKHQLVQHAVVQLCVFLVHVIPLLGKLHWLSVCFQVQLLTFKALRGMGLRCLGDRLSPISSVLLTRF